MEGGSIVRTYKFKLYNSDKNRYLSKQINVAASVWNHTVALQRRYYRMYGKYASVAKIGEYFVTIVCDDSETYPIPRAGKAVGMDFGLKHFLTLSDGSTIDSPEMFKHSINEIRKASKKLSRCKEGSNHKKAAKKDLDRAHEAIADRRKDWFYKLADRLTKEYAIICIEDLNIKAMQKLWGRKISDYAFAEFVSILEWEALKNGCSVIKVDRWLPSKVIYTDSDTCCLLFRLI